MVDQQDSSEGRRSPATTVRFIFVVLILCCSMNMAWQLIIQNSDSFSSHDSEKATIFDPSRATIAHLNATEQDALLAKLQNLSADQVDALLARVHGHEFPHPLTCARESIDESTIAPATTTVIVGYHVTMEKNWRSIFKDQLHTLHHCGLGKKLSHLYLTYSQPNNNKAANNEAEVRFILSRYPFSNKTTIQASLGEPIDGTALNMVHSSCQQQTNPEKAVAFYLHTQGNGGYTSGWEQVTTTTGGGYGASLYWRKYMEYFTIERPEICLNAILRKDKVACGVGWENEVPGQHYEGNFWSASCQYLNENEQIAISKRSSMRRQAAGTWIKQAMEAREQPDWSKFYKPATEPFVPDSLLSPERYDDFSSRWGK